MIWRCILITVFTLAENSLCTRIIDGYKELDDEIRLLQESDLFESMEPVGRQVISGIGILNDANNTEADLIIYSATLAATALIGVPVLLAAIAPPPLTMFPPQGLPQPGSVTEGGGILPSSEFIVRK